MFRLADGRRSVYQWDINVKLLLDESNESADEVHFSARFSRISLSVEVVHTEDSSYVTIPNILLQKPNDIIAYSCITNADGSYTKYDTIIPVIARPKPSGYIYEETETLTWKSLDDKINDLGESTANSVKYTEQELTDEQKAQARANIGAVSVGEVPEQVQTDWDQKDDTAADYLKNRPFGEGFPEDLGTYNFTATSETTITYVTAQDDGSLYVLTHLFNHKDISNATQVVINGETDLWTSSYDGKGHVNASGDKFSFHCYYNVGNTATITSNANIFTTGNTYPVLFRDVSDDSIKKIGSQYIPKSVYTFENAPIKFGSGVNSTVQGGNTTASGTDSHAEGYSTTASGAYSHAEGSYTTASGASSHAEGCRATASGGYSHAEGFMTSASSNNQHAQGIFNVIDSSGVYAHIVGNGTPRGGRSNAHALDWNGNAYYKGTVYVKGANPDASGGQEVATKSGWTANKYIGTDENGNLIEKDAPVSGTGNGDIQKTVYDPMGKATDVFAYAENTAESKVSAHNTESGSHSDIRELITGLTDRLNSLADSDDTTLDQLSEIVAYIKSNKSLIDAITTNKVSVSDIVDNLTSSATNKPLSAAQGKALKALIDAIVIPEKLPNPQSLTFTGAVTGSYDGSSAVTVDIPSGGSSGGSGKAKSQILINQEITELTASLSVTMEHDFHNLTAIISSGSDGAALTAGSDGTAVGSKIGIMVDTTSFSWNSRKVASTDTSKGMWETRMFGAEWSDDLSVFKRCFTTEIATDQYNKSYISHFGGTYAMYGTLGTDDNAPRTGKTANIVVNGAYLNVGTMVILWGEYYE